MGAAVTERLCGEIEHEPPCPLAPHHTSVAEQGATTRVRILFATEPEREVDVRRGIDEALAAGVQAGRWEVIDSASAAVSEQENGHVQRLVGS